MPRSQTSGDSQAFGIDTGLARAGITPRLAFFGGANVDAKISAVTIVVILADVGVR